MSKTADFYREWFIYDRLTGIVCWRKTASNRAPAGSAVTSRMVNVKRNLVYLGARLKGRWHPAHRIAFVLTTGRVPKLIDHINHNGEDNRWCNLREVTQSQNSANARTQRTKTIPLKGVSQHGSNYRARIRVNYKLKNIGTFKTPEEAHAAYVCEAERLFGEYASSGVSPCN